MQYSFNNQQAKNILSRLHADGLSSAIVAGGCVRDTVFGKPVKDIDIFVSFEDWSHLWVPDVYLVDTLDREVVVENWSIYADIPDVKLVYTIHPLANELPAQIIVMKEELSPLERLDKLDWGFCQAAWDGEKVVTTEHFDTDYRNQTMTLVHCEDLKEYDRSMVRAGRLKQKYPEFGVLVPFDFATNDLAMMII